MCVRAVILNPYTNSGGRGGGGGGKGHDTKPIYTHTHGRVLTHLW